MIKKYTNGCVCQMVCRLPRRLKNNMKEELPKRMLGKYVVSHNNHALWCVSSMRELNSLEKEKKLMEINVFRNAKTGKEYLLENGKKAMYLCDCGNNTHTLIVNSSVIMTYNTSGCNLTWLKNNDYDVYISQK